MTRFPLEFGIGARSRKKLERWGYLAEKEVWRYLQPSRYNTPTWRTDRQTDERTDRRTPGDSTDRAYA